MVLRVLCVSALSFSSPFNFQLSTVNLLFIFTSFLPYFYPSSMFRKPRQLETEEELYEVAVRALMENGLIDDARYAKQFARQRTQTRKQGKFRVARDLRARGVPDRHIDAAVEEATRETDEGAVVRQRIERKLRSYRGEIDDRKMASLYGSLLRAGFSADVVRRELKALVKEDLPDVELE